MDYTLQSMKRHLHQFSVNELRLITLNLESEDNVDDISHNKPELIANLLHNSEFYKQAGGGRKKHSKTNVCKKQLKPKPIANCPNHTIRSSSKNKTNPINTQFLKDSYNLFNSNKRYQFSQNVMTRNNPNNTLFIHAANPSTSASIPHLFSVTLSKDLEISNQHSSGRCWIFSALNVLRIEMAKKYSLPEDFELSQPYIFFYNKLELMNYLLQRIVETKNMPLTSPEVVHMLTQNFLGDGGQWNMFCNIINKYGIVPKSVYGETWNTKSTGYLNRILIAKFDEWAEIIRSKKTKNVQKCIESMMVETHRLLLIHLGAPPTKFDWSFYNDWSFYTKKGTKITTYNNLTPLTFYKKYVPMKADDFVSLIHDPRNKYWSNIKVKWLNNMEGVPDSHFINIPISKMKQLACATLKSDTAVWFTNDSGKYYDSTTGIWDTKQYNFELAYGTEPRQTKGSQLNYRQSAPNHAMIFTGCHIPNMKKAKSTDKNCKTIPSVWRIDNSWGKNPGHKGRMILTDSYFTEYVYQIVVPKKIANKIDKRILKIMASKSKPIVLPPWDVFGSVA
jgi:bleomycin hydrolase